VREVKKLTGDLMGVQKWPRRGSPSREKRNARLTDAWLELNLLEGLFSYGDRQLSNHKRERPEGDHKMIDHGGLEGRSVRKALNPLSWEKPRARAFA